MTYNTPYLVVAILYSFTHRFGRITKIKNK